MSGLFGFYCPGQTPDAAATDAAAMLQRLQHRGKDARWRSSAACANGELVCGETVLKTMPDADYQCQPMQSADRKFLLLYDGEVYNHEELRKELAADAPFETGSDAEVVLRALQKWGMKALTRFNGVFALVFADLDAGKVYFVRDRGGIRPLYVYAAGGNLIFASQLQAIQKHSRFRTAIDETALALFLRLGFVPEPFCIFRNCLKLRPGHYAEYDLRSGKMTVEQYWDLAGFLAMPKWDLSYQEAKAHLEELFLSSCEFRCAGPELPGCLLSGGYDSGGIAAFLSRLHPGVSTYTIGFTTGVDEAPDAERIARFLKTDHHQRYCTKEDAIDIIGQLPEIYDEPFGDSSAIPTTLAARLASGTGKIIFSADSGDETFGGYDAYRQALPLLEQTGKLPGPLAALLAWEMRLAAALPFPYDKRHALEHVADCLTGKIPPAHEAFLRSELKQLLRHPSRIRLEFLDRRTYNLSGMLFRDFHIGLAGDSLVKVDRAVTAAGIQFREPVMDHRITEFAARLPDSFKIDRQGGKKLIYKDLVHQYLPKELMDRPKHGFAVPLKQWITQDLKPLFEQTFRSANPADLPFFKTGGLEKVYRRYLADPSNRFHQDQVWFAFCFCNWYNRRVR